MPPKTDQPTRFLCADPNREPIRAVDQIEFHRSRTAHLDITCCAHVPVATSPTDYAFESIVTARRRTDLSMAKALAEGLEAQIAVLGAAASTKS